MPRYRHQLPQLADRLFLTDGGLETDLIFHDMVSAMTLTNVPEAVGIVRAARAAAMPVAISFTVETDGRLPTARPSATPSRRSTTPPPQPPPTTDQLRAPRAFRAVARPGRRLDPAHPRPARQLLGKSHAELDESPTLDEGDPVALGAAYRALRDRFPHLTVLGGCCGRDHHHVREIARACA